MIGPEVSTLEPVSRSHMTFPNLYGDMSKLPNLHHDLATGKAVSAALHFLNQTPIDAYTKSQSTVETVPMDLNLLLQGQQLTRSLTSVQP